MSDKRHLYLIAILVLFFVLSCSQKQGGPSGVEIQPTATPTSEPSKLSAPQATPLAEEIVLDGSLKAPVVKEDAEAFVLEKIIPAVSDGDVIAYQWPETFKPGDIVSNGEGEFSYTATGNTFVLWIDEYPGALFAHPTKTILIDSETGNFTIKETQWWPTVNGVGLWGLQSERDKIETQIHSEQEPSSAKDLSLSKSLAAKQAPVEKKEEVKPVEVAEGPSCPEVPCFCGREAERYCLIVNGYEDPKGTYEEEEDGFKGLVIKDSFGESESNAMVDLMKSKMGCGDIQYLSPYHGKEGFASKGKSTAVTNLKNLQAAFAKIAEKIDCCDEILLFVNAHGSEQGSFTLNPPHREKIVLGGGKTEEKEFGDPGGTSLTSDEFKGLLDSLKSCQIKVILETCYSGAQIENLSQPSRGGGCHCLTLYTSSAKDQVTWGNTFSNAFRKALSGGAASLDEAFDKAKQETEEETSDMSSKQTPQRSNTPPDSCSDNDGDKLTAGKEGDLKTNPDKKDTDGDGVDDYKELKLGLDPLNPDSDKDMVNDGQELIDKTDPKKPDTDNDGLIDGYEKFGGTNPKDPDTDDDIIFDGDEIKKGTDPLKPDTDGDRLDDGEEDSLGTDPLKKDTDGDGCEDGDEDVFRMDPKNPRDCNPDRMEYYKRYGIYGDR